MSENNLTNDAAAELTIDGKKYLLPIFEGTEGDKSIDIRELLRSTGYTLNAASNRGVLLSAIRRGI